jgi:hypothetical protein
MREGISVKVSAAERARLEAMAATATARKATFSALVLCCYGGGVGTNEIIRHTGTSKVTVWPWGRGSCGQLNS